MKAPSPELQKAASDRLREVRSTLNMTQTEIGGLLGVPWNTVARWERGTITIRHPKMLTHALNDIANTVSPLVKE